MWGHPTNESARATATPHAERHARSSNVKAETPRREPAHGWFHSESVFQSSVK
jgi:hypothetical protein